MKASPRKLIHDHYKTLVDARTGRQRPADHLLFEGLPALFLAVCWWRGVELPTEVSAGLVTVTGLLTAFLFGVLLQITERAMFWADTGPAQGKATTRQAKFLGQIAANSGYAALVSILTAMVFVGASVITGDTALIIVSALGIALTIHLVLILLMVITRVYALTQEQLIDTKTGATIAKFPRQKVG